MGRGDGAVIEQLPGFLAEIGKAQAVVDVADGPANFVCELLRCGLARAVFFACDEALEALGFFERANVFTLVVLDDLDFEDVLVGRRSHNGGQAGDAGYEGGAVAALAGDDFVLSRLPGANALAVEHSDDDRLNHAAAFQAFG